MPRIFKKIRLFLLSALMLFSLSSCSSFFADDGMMIDSITTEMDADGNTIVTIAFTDDYYDNVEFTIPAPEDGETGPQGPIGNGIRSITKVTEEGQDYLLITFTDENMAPAKIALPDTVSIDSITSRLDTETNVQTITITLTNGEKTEFRIQNGKDGAGISDITSVTDENGNTTITISYTDGRDDTVIQIPYKSGKDGEDGEPGRGISSMIGLTDPNSNQYYIFITYTDGEEDTIFFDAPNRGTIWYAGDGEPNPRVNFELYEALEGDFYFDLTNLAIYRYNGSSWILVGGIGNQAPVEEVTVTFNASENGGNVIGTTLSYTLNKGSTIPDVDLPSAYKEGERFIGWYTSPLGPSNPNAGHFTSLTPVFNNMTVYACFEVSL